jgi:hypothetical protein
MSEDLPVFVRDLIASPPKRGTGLNNWFFRVARVLHAFRKRDEIIALLEAATCGEPLQHDEIERAVDRSKGVAWKPEPSERITQQPAWPKVTTRSVRRSLLRRALALSIYESFLRFVLMTTGSTRRKSLTSCFQATRCCSAAARADPDSTPSCVKSGAESWLVSR